MNREAVHDSFLELIEAFNATQDDQHRIGASEASDILVGPGGDLDSLGTVNFLLMVEEGLSSIVGRSLSLLDEDFLLRFSTEGMTLGTFIDLLLSD